MVVLETANFWEAKKDPKWRVAIKYEIPMIEKKQTWKLMKRPENKKVIGMKWIFKTKLNADDSINKHKATFVVKGMLKFFGIDFSHTFVPIARLETTILLLAIHSQKGWKVFQLDATSAFLNGFLEEDIYIEKPEGFPIKGHVSAQKSFVWTKASA